MSVNRKSEHIRYAVDSMIDRDVFRDVHILYDSIPELDFDKLDTKARLLGSEFQFPIMINAMTGGSFEGKDINEALSQVAGKYNIPIAVGSQTIAVKDKSARGSFTVVRKVNKDGFIIANVGANAPLDAARQAINMIEADALQMHLNVLQELIMPEGDRSFTGILENIKNVVQNVSVPVIVKEVGFGMTKDTAGKLIDIGVKSIDIGGFGGTNFARIERLRRADHFCEGLDNVGIPTPVSLVEVCKNVSNIDVICGGGIRSGLDIAKAIIMGADAVSVAFPFLKAYKQMGKDGVVKEIERFIYEFKTGMIASGSGNIHELHKKRVLITGLTLEWINQLKEY